MNAIISLWAITVIDFFMIWNFYINFPLFAKAKTVPREILPVLVLTTVAVLSWVL